MDNKVDMQIVGEIIGAEYVRSPHGSAETFLKMHRLLAGLSALSELQVFTAAKGIFPAEYAAYLSAVDAGEIAPLICGPYANRFAVTFRPELN
jgi:hypothetical protein